MWLDTACQLPRPNMSTASSSSSSSSACDTLEFGSATPDTIEIGATTDCIRKAGLVGQWCTRFGSTLPRVSAMRCWTGPDSCPGQTTSTASSNSNSLLPVTQWTVGSQPNVLAKRGWTQPASGQTCPQPAAAAAPGLPASAMTSHQEPCRWQHGKRSRKPRLCLLMRRCLRLFRTREKQGSCSCKVFFQQQQRACSRGLASACMLDLTVADIEPACWQAFQSHLRLVTA